MSVLASTALAGTMFLTACDTVDTKAQDFKKDVQAMGFKDVSDATKDKETKTTLGLELVVAEAKPKPKKKKTDSDTDTDTDTGSQNQATSPKPNTKAPAAGTPSSGSTSRKTSPSPSPSKTPEKVEYYELTVKVAGCVVELQRKVGTTHVETTRKSRKVKVETYWVDEVHLNGDEVDADNAPTGAPTPKDVKNFLRDNRATFSCYNG